MIIYEGYEVHIKEPVSTTVAVTRTIKERLLTRPFKPFEKTRNVVELVEIVENGRVIKNGNHLFMNVRTWDELNKL